MRGSYSDVWRHGPRRSPGRRGDSADPRQPLTSPPHCHFESSQARAALARGTRPLPSTRCPLGSVIGGPESTLRRCSRRSTDSPARNPCRRHSGKDTAGELKLIHSTLGRLGDLAWWGIPRFVRGERYAFEHDRYASPPFAAAGNRCRLKTSTSGGGYRLCGGEVRRGPGGAGLVEAVAKITGYAALADSGRGVEATRWRARRFRRAAFVSLAAVAALWRAGTRR